MMRSRAAYHNHTVWVGRAGWTVTVPVPLRLWSSNQTDGGRDGHHPSNTIECTAVTALDGIGRVWKVFSLLNIVMICTKHMHVGSDALEWRDTANRVT